MATEKELQRLRESISNMAHTLDVFLEPHIQPSVADCEVLQQELYRLQELLAIYKYGKTNKELAPFFDLHSKVSEQEVVVPKVEMPLVATPVNELPEKKEIDSKEVLKMLEHETIVPSTIQVPVTPPLETESMYHSTPMATSSGKKMEINLNDKFRFINELFKQNQLEYSIAIEQLNTINTWEDAEQYLTSLKNIYGWNEKNEVVTRLTVLAKQRFNG